MKLDSSKSDAIGGYFELESSRRKYNQQRTGIYFQSARAGLYSLLIANRNIKRVWLPVYICNSVIQAVLFSGKVVCFYQINDLFLPNSKIDMSKGDVILYVHYFGIFERNVLKMLEIYGGHRVIIDSCQSYFTEPFECYATIYSPRKFMGVPDGGIVDTKMPVCIPDVQDEDSITRIRGAIKRKYISPEAGYKHYVKSEKSLAIGRPKLMSSLTIKILGSVNMNMIERKRLENARILHEALGSTNEIKIRKITTAPLCYPYLPAADVDKSSLISKRIFIPTYWPELQYRKDLGKMERVLFSRMLALPCDHRYSGAHIERIIEELKYA